jgi:hypothetical protein
MDHGHDHGDTGHTHDGATESVQTPVQFATPEQHENRALREQLRVAHELVFEKTMQLVGAQAHIAWQQDAILALQGQLRTAQEPSTEDQTPV